MHPNIIDTRLRNTLKFPFYDFPLQINYSYRKILAPSRLRVPYISNQSTRLARSKLNALHERKLPIYNTQLGYEK